jgi:hypothetical protein
MKKKKKKIAKDVEIVREALAIFKDKSRLVAVQNSIININIGGK